MITDGQKLALSQLQDISAEDRGAVEILSVKPPGSTSSHLTVALSLRCEGLQPSPRGIQFKSRERFTILIPTEFPFVKPEVTVDHNRFEGRPHVQWRRHLCLYQAPQTEWNPEDGMFGFFDRLLHWIRQAAVDRLDPEGAPLHPPVAYLPTGPVHIVIPRCDTPPVESSPWFGFAELREHGERRVDIVRWCQDPSDPSLQAPVAAAVLLHQPFPWEFPKTVEGVLAELERCGVGRRLLVILLGIAARKNSNEDSPIYLVLGTPMRGVRGGQSRQHLTAWYIPPVVCSALKLRLPEEGDNEEILRIREDVEEIILTWAKQAEMNWCRILEARPEVTVRRDDLTPMSAFRGRTVLLWGCGALGANVAFHLARAGVNKLILADNNIVRPGVIVRQPYVDDDIGRGKVHALADHLKAVRPDLEIESKRVDLISHLKPGQDWTEGADILIDCTASNTVCAKFELVRRSYSQKRIPVVSMIVSRRSQKGIVAVGGSAYTGGPADIYRKAKVETCKDPGLKTFAEEFYPTDSRQDIFQPEPGCSDPTFIGSSADASLLSALLLNLAAAELAKPSSMASAHFVTQPGTRANIKMQKPEASFRWEADVVWEDSHKKYELRVSRAALEQIRSWIRRNQRLEGAEVETGGILFGKRDDATRIIWITEVTGPPPDSSASGSHFLCGTDGLAEAHRVRKQVTKGEVAYIGSWHTHPASLPLPSSVDVAGMAQILSEGTIPPRSHLLLIVKPGEEILAGGFVFDRSDFSGSLTFVRTNMRVRPIPGEPERARKIGLALSGGGSRAIAFHLGCLRALHDRGVLSDIGLISSVSGGSVIAAMYAYFDDSFEQFERRVTALLRSGLQWDMLKELFLTSLLPAVLVTNIVGRPVNALARVLSKKQPLRRWRSRTDALERVLARKVFGQRKLHEVSRRDLEVVINATELRTGTAFRFGSQKSGNWRLGTIDSRDIGVARAVTASAAYPVLLPALDCEFDFAKGGSKGRQRVLLTDGGVYENLGLSCMEPGRDAEISTHVYSPDYIICCNAGHGMFSGDDLPNSLLSRSWQATAAIMRKNQDAAMNRLHRYSEAGLIKGFLLAYLGQNDRSLPYPIVDLVKREEVFGYPTDFRAMAAEDIIRLSLRGEQLTRALLDYYCPSL